MRYFFLVLFFIIVVLGVHGDIYKSPYTISQLNSLPSLYSFIPLTPIPGIVSTGLIFPFHTWVHSFSTTFTILLPFLISPPPLYQSPGQDLFYLLVLCFWRKKKKKHFCLFKLLYRVFHCDISIYMYYNPNWLVPRYFSSFNLSPLLMAISTGLNILHSLLYRKYISYIHLLNFLLQEMDYWKQFLGQRIWTFSWVLKWLPNYFFKRLS
jgi:hypothetical protein